MYGDPGGDFSLRQKLQLKKLRNRHKKITYLLIENTCKSN